MNKRNLLLFVLISVITIKAFSQIKFEKGYFIDNKGTKTECLIKNNDWNYNPSEFEFKLNESSSIKKGSIESIKEFAVNDLKYTRFVVNLDISSNQTNKLSKTRKPVFKKETLFLRSLVEGKANLYFYKTAKLNRFYFSVSNKDVAPLIFKRYNSEYNHIKENNRFKQQLITELKCPSISKKDIEKLKYTTKELVNIFINYNNCHSSDIVKYDKNKYDRFNLKIRPGINNSSLSIGNNKFLGTGDVSYDNEFTFRIGIETEFVLGFNKNKWAVIFEPTYQYFKTSDDIDYPVDYKSLELPLGIRHYFFLNDDSKFFLNSQVIYDIPFNSTIGHLDLESGSPFFTIGTGYNYKEKYSFEIRYLTERDFLDKYKERWSRYGTLSFIFGFNIL